MTKTKTSESTAKHRIPTQRTDSAIRFRIPRPNMQVAVLGIVAFITLFQTVQLVRISGTANAAPVKAVSTTTTSTEGSGTASNANTPRSMVGGC